MGLARVFGVCAALLYASTVGAANIIDLGPSDYRSFGPNGAHTSSGIRSSSGQTIRMPPSSGSLTVTRNAVIPYNSVANGLRNFTRVNPASVAASAAITALFLGLDWVFDQEIDSWMKEGVDYSSEDGYIQWQIANVPQRFDTVAEACEYRIASVPSFTGYEWTGDYRYTVSGTSAICYLEQVHLPTGNTSERQYGQTTRVGSECPPGYSFYPDAGACGESTLIDLDPSDWQRLEDSLPSADPSTVSGAAGDAMRRQGAPLPGYQDQTITGPSSISGPSSTSTSTDPVTGDTVVTTTNTTTNISYGDTTITTTNTTTSTSYQNGQETSTTVTTETPGDLPVPSGGTSAEWPAFCDWAVRVCEWLDWTQEDPGLEDPDLPLPIDEDYYQQKSISFGSKACPPDHQINLAPFLPNAVAVSFQPLCDFAGLIYHMVMAASYIIAAYITIGVARNG